MIIRISCDKWKEHLKLAKDFWAEFDPLVSDFLEGNRIEEFRAKKELFQKLTALFLKKAYFLKIQVRQMVVPFIAAYPEIVKQARLGNDPKKILGFFEESKAIIFDQDNLSINLKSDLYFPGKQVEKLPDNLTVNGNIDITNTPMSNLPRGLHVTGFLLIASTSIKELPPDLVVDGDFDMPNNIVESIPPSIQVGGNIEIGDEALLEDARKLKANGNLKGNITIRLEPAE